MEKEMKAKLVQILKDNTRLPLIIEGVTSENFPTAIVIPADIPSSDLGIIPGETGLKYPAWAMEIQFKAQKSDKIVLCIDGIDSISPEEQDKFYGMLKYKGVNGFKFPQNTQIIITAHDVSKISRRIASLALIYKVK